MKKVKCSICGKSFKFDEGDEGAYIMTLNFIDHEECQYLEYNNVCENCQIELAAAFEKKATEMKKRYHTE